MVGILSIPPRDYPLLMNNIYAMHRITSIGKAAHSSYVMDRKTA